MAPIEPDLSNSNFRPLAIFSSYLALATGLTLFISSNVLHGAFKSLPPSQATRIRASNRQKHIILFSVLAAASLGVTWWHLFGFFSLSYRNWAHELGQDVPERVYGERGIWGDGSTGLALGRWLTDTELFRDIWEIAVEKSRRYWWSQQVILGAAAWSVFLGIEGRRRNIRHLWAFMLLAETVALAFAMNLFFVAILLTAVPLTPRKEAEPESKHKRSISLEASTLTDRVSKFGSGLRRFFPPLPTKPHHHTWTPYPLAYFGPISVIFICAFLLPWATNDPLFVPIVLIFHLALFQPLYPQYLMPEAFGSTAHRHDWTTLSTLIAVFSFILHAKQTIVALFDSDPGAYDHRHSHYLAYVHLPHEDGRSRTYRSASALNRVLGAINDHPAISSIGWDVLMCGLSLGVWAAARGLEPGRMLSAIGIGEAPKPPATRKTPQKQPRKKSTVKAIADQVEDTVKSPIKTTTRRRKKQPAQDDPFVDAASKDDAGDKDFKSPASVEHEVEEFEADEELPENLESAPVSWGLLALGGLGLCGTGTLHA